MLTGYLFVNDTVTTNHGPLTYLVTSTHHSTHPSAFVMLMSGVFAAAVGFALHSVIKLLVAEIYQENLVAFMRLSSVV